MQASHWGDGDRSFGSSSVSNRRRKMEGKKERKGKEEEARKERKKG